MNVIRNMSSSITYFQIVSNVYKKGVLRQIVFFELTNKVMKGYIPTTKLNRLQQYNYSYIFNFSLASCDDDNDNEKFDKQSEERIETV